MNGNPFYVQPMGDYSGQLAGIGQTLQQIGQEKKAQARFNEVKSAMESAWQSQDPDQMMQVAIQYPEAQETVKQMFGLTNARTEREATNTYRRVMADPKNAEKYLTQGINAVSEAGGRPDNMLADLGMYRRDPQAAMRKIRMSYAAADPQGYGAMAAADKAARTQSKDTDTAAIKDLRFYQELKKTDPELAVAFGQERGYVSEEGKELSQFLQKRLAESTDAAIKSEGNSRGFNVLADEFAKADIQSGWPGQWSEALKQATGSQDAVSELRKKFNAIKASQVVNNLPPGAASDADIALALSGFPDSTANPQYLASFLRGLAKLEDASAEFNEFKADYISKNGHERNMLATWKKEKDVQDASGGGKTPPEEPEGPKGGPETETSTSTQKIVFTHPQLGDITEADIQQTMTARGLTRAQVMQMFQGGQ